MPRYLVEFDQPMVYLPDHYASRELQAMSVTAPGPAQAMTHAIRVTRGAGSIKQVLPWAEASPELQALAQAPFTLPTTIDPATGLRTALPPTDTALEGRLG